MLHVFPMLLGLVIYVTFSKCSLVDQQSCKLQFSTSCKQKNKTNNNSKMSSLKIGNKRDFEMALDLHFQGILFLIVSLDLEFYFQPVSTASNSHTSLCSRHFNRLVGIIRKHLTFSVSKSFEASSFCLECSVFP